MAFRGVWQTVTAPVALLLGLQAAPNLDLIPKSNQVSFPSSLLGSNYPLFTIEATWENLVMMNLQFPEVDLGDKDRLEGEGLMI